MGVDRGRPGRVKSPTRSPKKIKKILSLSLSIFFGEERVERERGEREVVDVKVGG